MVEAATETSLLVPPTMLLPLRHPLVSKLVSSATHVVLSHTQLRPSRTHTSLLTFLRSESHCGDILRRLLVLFASWEPFIAHSLAV